LTTSAQSIRPARIAVTGASGFLGRHFIDRAAREGVACRGLSRKGDAAGAAEMIAGDLRERSDVERLFRGCDAVVNLAYASEWSDADNDAITANLIAVASDVRPRRFVHVSTAVVVGSCTDSVINEQKPCRPETEYQRRKLRIEEQLAEGLENRVPLAILRPTAVFGPGGRNLMKLVDDLRRDSPLMRSLRFAVLRRRRLNLVSVSNVVEAIWFLLTSTRDFRGDRFIVSDDDDPRNNYGDVSAYAAAAAGLGLWRWKIPLLEGALPLLLRVRGRSLTNPDAVFSASKLREAGFQPPAAFNDELSRFLAWYLSLRTA